MVMVRVSIMVFVMILFCRSIALFSVFYAFHIYILYSTMPHYTRTHVIDMSWRFISLYGTIVTHIPGGFSEGTQTAGTLVYTEVMAVMYGLQMRLLTDSNLPVMVIGKTHSNCWLIN